jgi:predicted permease
MTLRRLKLLTQAVFARRRVERDLDDELAFHIERETQKQIASGVSPAEARTRAMARFGSVTVAADECRDARGTTLVDGIVRDLWYAFRSFRHAPLVAVTIVATVGLGLGLVTVVFTLLNAAVFRTDDVRDPHELFSVERQLPANAKPEPFTRPQYEALRRETGVFSDAFVMGPEVDWWIDGRRMEGALVAGNFFHVLGAGAARGRTLVPSDDELGGRHAIVLSHRAWSRYFEGDPGVLDRPVQLNGVPFQVVGVMPEGFRGLSIAAPDFWAPLSLLGEFRPSDRGRDGIVGLSIVGRLKPGLSRGQALAELQAWDSRAAASNVGGPAAKLELEPRQGPVPLSAETMLVFMPLFFAFGLILLIACANVANLLLARAVVRQREIGIRLAIGASRRRIIRQLLTESLLLALISAAVGFAISRLVLAATVYALASTWSLAFGDIRLATPPADWRVALFLISGAAVSTLFFALAPALQATRLELVRAMRGEVVRDARPGRARDALVALQVTASVLLLICSAIFLRSTWAIANVDPGIRTADTVGVGITNEQMRAAVLDAVRREPSVAAVAASWPGGLGGPGALAEAPASGPGGAGGATGKSAVTYQFVSPEYFGVLGIDIVRGRGFAANERSADAAVVVVSETVARQLWPDLDAIGQTLRLEPDPKSETPEPDDLRQAGGPALVSRAVVVVGVARDVAGFKLGGTGMSGTGVYLPTDAQVAKTGLMLRVHGDPERASRSLAERLKAIEPDVADVIALRSLTRMAAYLMAIPFWLTLVLGALALVLTLSGLFSVLSYLVEQRTREVGIRMALGATGRDIGRLVVAQSARPVVIGLLLGGSLTAALGGALLATPAAEYIASIVRLFDPAAYAASLLIIVAACAGAALVPALRAGRIDPVAALRQD